MDKRSRRDSKVPEILDASGKRRRDRVSDGLGNDALEREGDVPATFRKDLDKMVTNPDEVIQIYPFGVGSHDIDKKFTDSQGRSLYVFSLDSGKQRGVRVRGIKKGKLP